MHLTPKSSTHQRKRIVVIGGGGASGLAALRIFLGHPKLQGPHATWEIHAYEARRDVGGIWLPEAPGESKEYEGIILPPTPLYDSLTTNLPHPLMAYHDFPFPPETPLFPRASVVRKYLEDYATYYNLRRHISLNTGVESAWWDSGTSEWVITLSPNTDTATPITRRYDAMIVASGHYGLPYMPEIPGAEDWKASGRHIIHSIWYREPSIFKGRTLLVVGGGPSGFDLVADSAAIARTVIHSTSNGVWGDNGNIKRRSRLVELRPSDGAAVYGDGTTDTNIDVVVLATGYSLTFPFLRDLPQDLAALSTPLPGTLNCTGFFLHPLARHTFPLRTYSPKKLAFVGLPVRLAPFPAADCQALAIASVFLDDDSSTSLWDHQREEALVSSRFAAMVRYFGGDSELVARSWHKVFHDDEDIGDWDDYRASLLELGPKQKQEQWAVQKWEREIYNAKSELRAEWVTLEREGVAGNWLKGVGKLGPQEWVSLMYRVLEHARRRSASAQGDQGLPPSQDCLV
jgi:hypothetical protein